MAQVNIRMDDNIKEKADALFAEMGMNMTTAFNIFAREVIRKRAIPFVVGVDYDPFYSESNMNALRESIAEFDNPAIPKIVKTMEELEAMENE